MEEYWRPNPCSLCATLGLMSHSELSSRTSFAQVSAMVQRSSLLCICEYDSKHTQRVKKRILQDATAAPSQCRDGQNRQGYFREDLQQQPEKDSREEVQLQTHHTASRPVESTCVAPTRALKAVIKSVSLHLPVRLIPSSIGVEMPTSACSMMHTTLSCDCIGNRWLAVSPSRWSVSI